MPKKPTRPTRRRTSTQSPPSPLDALLDQFTDRALDTLDMVMDHFQNQASRQLPGTGPTPRPGPRMRPPNARGHQQPPPPRPAHAPVRSAYDVLQVHPKADPETITAAYRSLAKRFHPDNGETGNADRMKEIVAAYEVLNDPHKRKVHDRIHNL